MVESIWQLYPQKTDICEKIAAKININPIIAQILLNRDVKSIDAIKQFLNPPDISTHNFGEPLLEKVASLVNDAQEKKKKVLIFGDYDADGITSAAILTKYLQRTNHNVSFYVPNRFTEGYGLGEIGVKYAIDNKIDLMITVDCGISNHKEIKQIKEGSKTKIIIIDHHSLPDPLPIADGILNPKMLGPENPIYFLCSGGISYKFLEYYCKKYDPDYNLEDDLDLVALATIADIVPLVDENRRLAKLGMKVLSKFGRPGIRNLLEINNFKKKTVNARDIGFVIGPHINAAGRLASGSAALELLIEGDDKTALAMALKLKTLNEKRRQMGTSILEDAVKKLTKEDLEKNNIIALSDANWHSGIIGITCSQLARKYHRPVVLISAQGKEGRGSARTYGTINIYQILKECSHLCKGFGGHKAAAGFSIEKDKIEEFLTLLKEKCQTAITKRMLSPVIDIDYHLAPKDITMDFITNLFQLAPFGNANQEPTFYTNQLTPIDFKTVGNGTHLKVTFTDKSGKQVFDAIGFSLSEKIEKLYKKEVEIIFTLDTNDWSGRPVPQLKLIDIK